MTTYEVSREDLMAELKRDLESGRPLANPAYKVRAAKPMGKEEFGTIRKGLKVTQSQLAEILDISVKTVQAYEQGRAEIPGLVSKVLRLMQRDGVFRGIFRGEMSQDHYSDYVRIQQVLDIDKSQNSKIQLAETLIQMVNDLQTDSVGAQIEALTTQPVFVMNSQQ
jgi:DNA-binding transcriptional regulator YiaG